MERFKKLQKLLREWDWKDGYGSHWTSYNIEFETDRYILQIVDNEEIRYFQMAEIHLYKTLEELATILKELATLKERELEEDCEEDREIYFWQEVKEIANSILKDKPKEN